MFRIKVQETGTRPVSNKKSKGCFIDMQRKVRKCAYMCAREREREREEEGNTFAHVEDDRALPIGIVLSRLGFT